MRVGLFSYHAEFATAEYFAKAIVRDGHELFRLGMCHPQVGGDPAPAFETVLPPSGVDLLLFIDPPGPIWPIGWEALACPTVGYLIDVHQSLDIRLRYAPFFDHLFIAQKDFLDEFHARGFRAAEWLPFACDPETHRRSANERCVDVGFVGKLGRRGSERHRTLLAVLERYNTNDFSRYYAPEEMGLLYSQCKIVFNRSINGDLNMRVFEAMASGALLITDRIQNGLGELFQEGAHYVAYSSVEEAIDRIDYFLGHDRERREIAAAGQLLTCSEHTYSLRWRRISELALDETKRSAAVRKMKGHELGRAYARVYEALRKPSGLLRLVPRYGLSWDLIIAFVRASAMALNAIVPLSPGAMRARLGR